jgi:hypothetical protein
VGIDKARHGQQAASVQDGSFAPLRMAGSDRGNPAAGQLYSSAWPQLAGTHQHIAMFNHDPGFDLGAPGHRCCARYHADTIRLIFSSIPPIRRNISDRSIRCSAMLA